MAVSTNVEGALVAHHTRAYDFNDRVDGRRVQGENYFLHIVQSFEAEPVRVKVRDKGLYDALIANGPGAKVRLLVEVIGKPTPGGNATEEIVLVQALPVEAKRQAG